MEAYKNLLEMVPKLRIGINFSQFMLFTINFVFAVVATLLLIMAYAINLASQQYTAFLTLDHFEPVVFLIAFGAIMYILSFFGGMATIARSTLFVNIYGVLLLILLILEINATITTFIIHGNIYSSVESNLVENMNNRTTWNWNYVREKWNDMQDRLDCCGVHNSQDWAPLHVDGPEIVTDDGYTYTVPYSCCANYFNHFHTDSHCYASSDGCLIALSRYISKSLELLGYLTLATVLSQLLGLIFAFSLSRNIRRLKTEQEMKRQEIQHLIYTDLHKPEEEKPLLTSSSSNA